MSRNLAETHYVSLPDVNHSEANENLVLKTWSRQSGNAKHIVLWYRGILVCQNLVILALAVIVWSKCYSSHETTCSQVIYSPAQHLLEYYPVIFSKGFGNETTIYQASPSDMVDNVWTELYNKIDVSKISENEEKQLFTQTVPDPGGQYVISLSVFHELHCLNVLRKALRPDYYKDPVTGAIDGIEPNQLEEHISHCIDELRQSAICHSDISPIVWYLKSPTSRPVLQGDVVHSCRRFDKIVEWAKKHKAD